MSRGNVSYFFLYMRSEAYTICTLPSDKSLFLHKPLSVKLTPHSPHSFHKENATEKY